jgi:hypothetical protein
MYEQLCAQTLPFLAGLTRTFSSPYTWDAKIHKFVLIKEPKYIRSFTTLSLFSMLYMVVVTCSLLQTFRSETSILLKMTCIGISLITVAITIMRYMHTTGAIQTVHFLNLMVDFEISHADRRTGREL